MRGQSSRDGRRQSRLVKGNAQGYEIYTVDHKKGGKLRLDATVLYSDSCEIAEELTLDAEPSECSTLTFANKHEDYDHELWFSAYVPQENDGCQIMDANGTLNPSDAELDFSSADQVCWWHMKDGAVLGVHNGMIIEYDASTLAPLGMVVSRDELQDRRVAVIDDECRGHGFYNLRPCPCCWRSCVCACVSTTAAFFSVGRLHAYMFCLSWQRIKL
ncbi:GRINA [Symbiodinium pilosum]|uniref:GRINA protein n=1 Tax=Symbiodinium pilosum TaxID=2952 RepID=A0A812XYC7_SYMPI|nr:GRINA [Symbiodinium pilosum]